MKKIAGLFSFFFIGFAFQSVSAADFWDEASKRIAADSDIVLGLNLKELRSTQLFKTLSNKFITQNQDAKKSVDMIRSACNIDALNELENIILAVNPSEDVLVFMQFAKLNEKKLGECIAGINKKQKKNIEMKKTGNIIEFSEKGKTLAPQDIPYVSWIGANTLLLSGGKNGKALLEKALASEGDFLKSETVKQSFSKINLKSVLWGYTSKNIPISQKIKINALFGSVDAKGGKINVDLKLSTADKVSAQHLLTETNTNIKQSLQEKGIPPQIKNTLKGLKLSVENAIIVVKTVMLEKDLIALIQSSGF